MARPVRHTGINGARLRYLRHKEQWNQTDLANQLGVHRATLARWETGEGDPPYEVVEKMCELFKVPPAFLFEVAPLPDYEGEPPEGAIIDPLLKRIPLSRLQKNTLPALEAISINLKQLKRKVPKIPLERLQEILNGQKPTAAEIQLLKNGLGDDFNPVSSVKKRTLAETKTEDVKLEFMVILAELVVRAVEQESKGEQFTSAQKKQLAMAKLTSMAEGLELNSFPTLLDVLIEASLQRINSGQESYNEELSREYGVRPKP